MKPRMRTLGTALLVAVVVTACGETEPAQGRDTIYQREQEPADVLPSHVANGAEIQAQDWDQQSSRLLAAHAGHEFFVVRSATEGNCLVTVDQDRPQPWVASCSPSSRIGMSGPAGVRAELDLDGFDENTPPLEGWTRPVPELQVLVPRRADRP
ncbi:hypothetical protein GCM10011374_02950 [Kocuria dechangensis]|uniref:Lipoprotein n=1 Tax=Kocuria dechangensis TaxID=1176249 RepID=A0A917GFP9_9MICC|nr:hypothetical protein [Kocuria dechangensis]GGG44006.1 hypothetical protein GCM10011374_02950 [Kocuria dechangensis]